MSKYVRLILAVWATYRLASMVGSDEGPYIGWPQSEQQTGIFKALRIKLGVYEYGSDGKAATNLARGISCPLCTGVYISGLLSLLVFSPNLVGDWFLAWMGISGAQVFLENLTSDDAIQSAIEEVAESLE